MTDKIVTVKGVAALARQGGIWPYGTRTEVGVLDTGEPVSVYVSAVIVDMRPARNRRAL